MFEVPEASRAAPWMLPEWLFQLPSLTIQVARAVLQHICCNLSRRVP